MGTRAPHPALGRLRRETRGQAFTELVLVLFLFSLLLTAVLQFVWIGSAQIRCQQAARRAAWLWNSWNNADPHGNGHQELQYILPGCSDPVLVGSFSAEAGSAYRIEYTVPAIGFFRLISPNGFHISATAAAIARNEQPIVKKGINEIWAWVQNKLGAH